MFKKTAFITILFFILLFTLTACTKEVKNKEDKQALTIYTTVYPLQYFTEQIGGEHVNVQSIYPNGGDEHTFEPTQKDFIRLAESDLFFYIGYGLEGFISKAKSTLKNENVKMVAIGETVQLPDMHEEEEDEDDHDSHDDHNHSVNPHIWLDPLYCIEMSESITKELIKRNPEHKAEFEENLSKLKEKLLKLNDDYQEVASTAKSKNFLVSHAAFNYWESRYGLHQLSVLGLSTTDEPTQKQLRNLIDLAKEENIRIVLVEQNVSSKIPEVVKKEINGSTLPIHNLAILSDQDQKEGADYFSIAEKNLDSLKKALNN